MTPELTYLTWTAVLCIVLWIPYIVAGTSRHGFLTAADYRVPGSRALPPWADRAERAHLNLVENLPSFAALVLVAHLVGVSTEATAFAAAAFFWARVVQTVVHLAGIPYVRTAAFAVGTFAQLVIASEILFQGPA